MKAADRSGAALALIVGEQELADGVVSVRPLREGYGGGEQQTVPRDQVVDLVAKILETG